MQHLGARERPAQTLCVGTRYLKASAAIQSVCDVCGKVITLDSEVEPSETIGIVKSKIQDRVGIPSCGLILRDENTLLGGDRGSNGPNWPGCWGACQCTAAAPHNPRRL